MTAIAMCIAEIAKIELPRKEWNDLISTLSQNSNHHEMYIRHAALQAICFICEELEPADLSDQQKTEIILSLCNNIFDN